MKAKKVFIVAQQDITNGLYKLEENIMKDYLEVEQSPTIDIAICSSKKNFSATLRYKHLKHFYLQVLRWIISYVAMRRLFNILVGDLHYLTCISKKQKQTKILKVKISKITNVFQLIHSNIVRSFWLRSLRGASYFVSFIDNFSKKI